MNNTRLQKRPLSLFCFLLLGSFESIARIFFHISNIGIGYQHPHHILRMDVVASCQCSIFQSHCSWDSKNRPAMSHPHWHITTFFCVIDDAAGLKYLKKAIKKKYLHASAINDAPYFVMSGQGNQRLPLRRCI